MQFLSERFDLVTFNFKSDSRLGIIGLFFRQFFFLLRHIFSSELVVCQFAGFHSLLPGIFARLSGRSYLVIVGGTDCVSFPSIRYGNFHKPLLAFFTRNSYRLCHHISPVHGSLIEYEYTYQDKDFPRQGILYFVPGLKKKFTVIYNGYDPEVWKPCAPKKKGRFIMLLGFYRHFTFALKGVDLVREAAAAFPGNEFIIIGMPEMETKKHDFPANVKLTPFIDNRELPALLSSAEFYLQLSISEGFPNAICEAMLCGCTPIGSKVAAIPDIVGNTGFILEKRDAGLLKELLQKALDDPQRSTRGEDARARVAALYTEEERKNKLLKLCVSLSKRQKGDQ
jgi:glycosyltransferase involved in cell wall biosynthesis